MMRCKYVAATFSVGTAQYLAGLPHHQHDAADGATLDEKTHRFGIVIERQAMRDVRADAAFTCELAIGSFP
jgi:hypothetical protein